MVRTGASVAAQFIPVDVADVEALFVLDEVAARASIDQRWRALLPAARILALGELRRTVGKLLRPDREQHDAFERRVDLEIGFLFDEQARRHKDELARRDRLLELGQLSASIAHELRDPLGVIESSAFLLGDKPDDPHRRMKHVTRIHDEVRRCKRIIEDLLTLIRRLPIGREPIFIESLVAAAIQVTSGAESDASAEVTFSSSDLSALPPARGHEGLLLMALGNLVRNAKQFALHTVRIDGRSAAGAVELSIEDDGPGVAASVLPTLFEPLASARPGGTGLGLALARRIAEHHGGSLRHEATPRGARFVLRLPTEIP